MLESGRSRLAGSGQEATFDQAVGLTVADRPHRSFRDEIGNPHTELSTVCV